MSTGRHHDPDPTAVARCDPDSDRIEVADGPSPFAATTDRHGDAIAVDAAVDTHTGAVVATRAHLATDVAGGRAGRRHHRDPYQR
jgi:hypothetical protein